MVPSTYSGAEHWICWGVRCRRGSSLQGASGSEVFTMEVDGDITCLQLLEDGLFLQVINNELMRACSLVCCAACPVLMYTHKNRCASFSARVYTHEWKLSFYTRVGVYTVTVCTQSHMSFQREFLMRQEASIATFQIKIVLTINQVRWQ